MTGQHRAPAVNWPPIILVGASALMVLSCVVCSLVQLWGEVL